MPGQLARQTLVLAIALTSAGAGADCDDDGNNRLAGANCGFDSDLSLWNTSVVGSFSHDGVDGSPDAGSLVVDAETTFTPTMTLVSPCVPLPSNTNLGYGIHHRLRSGTTPDTCFVNLIQFDGAGCSGGFDNSLFGLFSPAAGWTAALGVGTTESTTLSGRMQVVCDGGFPTWQLGMDNGFIGPGLTVPVELMDFAVE